MQYTVKGGGGPIDPHAHLTGCPVSRTGTKVGLLGIYTKSRTEVGIEFKK